MPQLKYEKLINILKDMKKVAIAFSGGVDSAFLLKAALDALSRENVLAITIESQVITEAEMRDLKKQIEFFKARHRVIKTDILSLTEFKDNSSERCYFCKKYLFQKIIKAAKAENYNIILDGTNADDEGDFRPGIKALKELSIRSPLKECSLNKNDIRELSKTLGLITYDKPSLACLASRIPYGEEITEDKLRMVEKAEDYLRNLGFRQFRVRHHNLIARIEIESEDFLKIFENGLNIKINDYFKTLGFKYITLDLMGFRTGSLNEVL